MNYYRKYIDRFSLYRSHILCYRKERYIYCIVKTMHNFTILSIVIFAMTASYCQLARLHFVLRLALWHLLLYFLILNNTNRETISPNTNQPWSYTSMSHSQTFSTANKIWSLLKEKIFEDFVFQFRLIS